MQELLPRAGPGGVTERGAVGAAPQAVAAGLEPDAPPEGQVPGGLEFAEDDRAVPHRGPDHGKPRVAQRREQWLERCGIHQLHTAGLDRLIHGFSSAVAPLGAVSGRPVRRPGTGTGHAVFIVARRRSSSAGGVHRARAKGPYPEGPAAQQAAALSGELSGR